MKAEIKIDTAIALLIIATIIIFRYSGCSSNNKSNKNSQKEDVISTHILVRNISR